jgi:hypothetical protein
MSKQMVFSGLWAGLVFSSLVSAASAQSPFATQVIQFNQGTGGGLFDPSKILGGPTGEGLSAGSTDVLTLGEAGSAVLGFEVVITDGPGADLIVFENGFVFGAGSVFAELLYVEVSTDGAQFARFPTAYSGPGTPMGSCRGLGGGLPVLSNVQTNSISPFDAVVSWGEAFDLADLSGHALVVGGQVDLTQIHFVRLVDVPIGDSDANGNLLPAAGGADVDAVAVVNSNLSGVATAPVCDLSLNGSNQVVLRVGDPQGFFDLDLASLAASINLSPVSVGSLLPLFTVTGFDGNVLELTSGPLTGTGLVAALALSASDLGGQRSTDQLMLQD